MFIEAAIIMVSSARKNSRPRMPMKPPISSSEKIVPPSEPRLSVKSLPSSTRGLPPVSAGASARLSVTAMNSLTGTGVRALEKPGATIRQAPMRQNSTKIVAIIAGAVATRVEITRSFPAT